MGTSVLPVVKCNYLYQLLNFMRSVVLELFVIVLFASISYVVKSDKGKYSEKLRKIAKFTIIGFAIIYALGVLYEVFLFPFLVPIGHM